MERGVGDEKTDGLPGDVVEGVGRAPSSHKDGARDRRQDKIAYKDGRLEAAECNPLEGTPAYGGIEAAQISLPGHEHHAFIDGAGEGQREHEGERPKGGEEEPGGHRADASGGVAEVNKVEGEVANEGGPT